MVHSGLHFLPEVIDIALGSQTNYSELYDIHLLTFYIALSSISTLATPCQIKIKFLGVALHSWQPAMRKWPAWHQGNCLDIVPQPRLQEEGSANKI